MIGIGSPRASVESNYALRALVGAENFYSGVSADEQRRLELMHNILQNGGSIHQAYAKWKITMQYWFWVKI